MPVFSLAVDAIQGFAVGSLAALLCYLRRAGRADVAAERVVAAMAALIAARMIVAAFQPFGWLWYTLAAGPPLVAFGLLAARVRQYTHVLLSPATVRRLRSCKGHR